MTLKLVEKYLKNRMKHNLFFFEFFFYCLIRTKCIWLLIMQLVEMPFFFVKTDKGKFSYENVWGTYFLLDVFISTSSVT